VITYLRCHSTRKSIHTRTFAGNSRRDGYTTPSVTADARSSGQIGTNRPSSSASFKKS